MFSFAGIADEIPRASRLKIADISIFVGTRKMFFVFIAEKYITYLYVIWDSSRENGPSHIYIYI